MGDIQTTTTKRKVVNIPQALGLLDTVNFHKQLQLHILLQA
jgi:hypothetical protein